MNSDDKELNRQIEIAKRNFTIRADQIKETRPSRLVPFGAEEGAPSNSSIPSNLAQWTTADDQQFWPAASSRPMLPPGYYEIVATPKGLYFQRLNTDTDGILRLEETVSGTVTEEIGKFWDRAGLFAEYGFVHKRGILLWGVPGSGKTCTIKMVVADVVARGGVAVKFTEPDLFHQGLLTLRRIQPETPLVVVMEDLDAILKNYDESAVLNILDGVEAVSRIVFLATTNFPGLLGARIVNRPSRFDKRFRVPLPGPASRRIYFTSLFRADHEERWGSVVPGLGRAELIDRVVEDTEGMSFAHLKELFVAAVILGDDYGRALETLRGMIETADRLPEEDDGVDRGPVGFARSKENRSYWMGKRENSHG